MKKINVSLSTKTGICQIAGKNWDVIFFQIVKARPANYDDKQMRLGNAARNATAAAKACQTFLSLWSSRFFSFSVLFSRLRRTLSSSVVLSFYPGLSVFLSFFLSFLLSFFLSFFLSADARISLSAGPVLAFLFIASPLLYAAQRGSQPRERGGYATVVGQKVEEEKEEEAHRDSYLLLSLFLLFSCPPSAAAPSSFIALLLLLLEPSAGATQLYVPWLLFSPSRARRARRATLLYFYCPSSLPLGRVTTLSPFRSRLSALFPSLKPRARARFFFLPFYLPFPFFLLFSVSPASSFFFPYLPPACRGCLWSVLSKEGWRREHALAPRPSPDCFFFFFPCLLLSLPSFFRRFIYPLDNPTRERARTFKRENNQGRCRALDSRPSRKNAKKDKQLGRDD